MKVILGTLAVIILMIGAPCIVASTEYQSGYKHGVIDVKDSCLHPDGCHWYILQPGKGFAFHTKEFIRGYITGFCLHVTPGGGSDADQARFECGKPDWFPEGLAQTVYAESAFKHGFKRGVSDFNHGYPWSVLTPTGNIFDKYPKAFYDGWQAGMCSKGYGGSDADELTFDCGHNVPYEMFQTHNTAYIAGFDDGVIDRRDGAFIQEKVTGFGADFAKGYIAGWRSLCYQADISTYCHLPDTQADTHGVTSN